MLDKVPPPGQSAQSGAASEQLVGPSSAREPDLSRTHPSHGPLQSSDQIGLTREVRRNNQDTLNKVIDSKLPRATSQHQPLSEPSKQNTTQSLLETTATFEQNTNAHGAQAHNEPASARGTSGLDKYPQNRRSPDAHVKTAAKSARSASGWFRGKEPLWISMALAGIFLTAAGATLIHVLHRNHRNAVLAEQQKQLNDWRAGWREAAAKGQFLIKESNFSAQLQPYPTIA